jgi:adenosylcobinamide kinase/adenosylcobinamide-phosphate guanylyltransferase
MKKIIFVTGSAKSGKSDFALRLAGRCKEHVTFIATSLVDNNDKEMIERIKRHKKKRPSYWKTIEESEDLISALKGASRHSKMIVVDCLTLWVSNLFKAGKKEEEILKIAEQTIKAAQKIKSSVIFISNEVGSGIVPRNRLARYFRDVLGEVNQIFSRQSNEAYLLVSGIPLRLK